MLKFAASRFVIFLAVLSLFAGAAQAASVIVELNDEPAAMAAARARASGAPMSADALEAYRASLSAAQDRLLDRLRASGIAFQLGGQTVAGVRIDYRYTLVFNGINLIVDPAAIPALEAMPEIKKVHPDQILYTTLDASVPYIRAPQVYGAVKELTRFNQEREGFEGQGIYVSVIDTGIEWQHEMFGGDPTPPRLGVEPPTAGRNEKVVYNLPLMDVVAEDGVGHGTHVASTAAGYLGFAPGSDGLPGTADDIAMHGVAPQARLMSYKVCSDALSSAGSLTGAVGGCFESVITMAIEDSVSPRTVNGFSKPVAHVINMSLGGSGHPDSVTAAASDNAVRLGTSVVAAGGNEGPGPSTVGAPCVGRLVTCVANSIDPAGSWSFDVLAPSSVNRLLPGAVTPASSLPLATDARSGVQLIPMSGSTPPPSGSVAQYYVYVAGGETPLSYPANVSGRIAIVRTSLQATFGQVANSAAAAGAIALIMRTDVANPTAVKTTIPATVLNVADFDALVALMGAGAAPASGTLSKHPLRLNPFFGSTTMNSSSSRGPVAGFGQVKPDLTAPGTNIMAALPPASLLGALAQSHYGAISGTSMASPHVAGAAALVKQAHLDWSPAMIRTALMNASTNLRNERGAPKGDGPATEAVLDQGAGLIDVYEAVNAKALLGVAGDGITTPEILGSHSFGEVPAINGRAVVTRSVAVSIRDLSGAAGTWQLAVVNNRGLEIPGIAVSAPSSITVPANGTASFDVAASIDGSLVTTGDPIDVQWYIRATRTDGAESLSMPFYLRATRTVPPAAALLPIADDSTPDRDGGIDRDGNFALAWTYPGAGARPCGFRIEEARPSAGALLYDDDAEELMLPGGNSRWTAVNWTSKPHAGTGSNGYGAVYIDQSVASITTATDVHLPLSLITLTFASDEDIEPGFDYGYVDVSIDGGTTWTAVATYTGAFAGTRTVDLSAFAGNPARIRFRLVSDQLMSTPVHLGWTVDDIRVQAGATFSQIAQATGEARSADVTGKTDGFWAYRVTPLFDNCSSPFVGAPSNIEQIEVRNATFAPTASFSGAPNPSNPGESVALDASASSDGDGVGGTPGIAEYRWSFGDGETATSQTPAVSHAWAAPGTYRVQLTVIDGEGESASTEALQTVRDPNASISGGGQITTASGKVNFSVDVSQSVTGASGSVAWHDAAGKTKIVSTRITSVEKNGSTATIRGECSINKKTASSFVLELVDRGATGDSASISAGSYGASGAVAQGGIAIQ